MFEAWKTNDFFVRQESELIEDGVPLQEVFAVPQLLLLLTPEPRTITWKKKSMKN